MPAVNTVPGTTNGKLERWFGNSIRGEIYEDVVMGGAKSKALANTLPKGAKILGSHIKNMTAMVYGGTATRGALAVGATAFTVAIGGGCSPATTTKNADQMNGSTAAQTGAAATKAIGGTASEPATADTTLYMTAVTNVPADDAGIITGTYRVRVFYERMVAVPDAP